MSETNSGKGCDSPTVPPTRDELLEWLRPVEDPEMFMSLVDLGLIYNIDLEGDKVHVRMTLTSPGCPAADYLVNAVKERMEEHPAIKEASVIVVFDPKWDPRTMASDEVKDRMGIW